MSVVVSVVELAVPLVVHLAAQSVVRTVALWVAPSAVPGFELSRFHHHDEEIHH